MKKLKITKLTTEWMKENRSYPPKPIWLEALSLIGEWEGSLIFEAPQKIYVCITKKYLKSLLK
ncbi:MAG: hypothetical protein NUV65_03060 [Candidatus Roizmanbacteria bacterium]|nr:hypothetical protein [Candidatus Roizmanbacteria bacterium]